METNKRILRSGLLAIGLVMAVCLGLSAWLWLGEPVFFKNYLELSGWETHRDDADNRWQRHDFQFQYVTNYNDDRSVYSVEFLEKGEVIPDLSTEVNDQEGSGGGFFSFDPFGSEENVGNAYVYGLYAVKTHQVYVTSRVGEAETIHLSEARIQFTDGTVCDVDLGEILLYPYSRDGLVALQSTSNSMVTAKGAMVSASVYDVPYTEGTMEDEDDVFAGDTTEDDRLIRAHTSSSSSDGSSSMIFTAQADITIDSIEFYGFPDAEVLLEMNIDGIPAAEVSGMQIGWRQDFQVQCRQNRLTGYGQYDQYVIRPVILYHDEEGNQYLAEIHNASQQILYWNEFTFSGLIQHLREEGVV